MAEGCGIHHNLCGKIYAYEQKSDAQKELDFSKEEPALVKVSLLGELSSSCFISLIEGVLFSLGEKRNLSLL